MAITSVTFTSRTGDDGKDHDTGVFVRVLTLDRGMIIASVEDADDCGDCEYDDQTTHTLNLRVNSPGLTRAQCAGFVYEVGAAAHPDTTDNWNINDTSVEITFDDGSALKKASGGFSLHSIRGALVWAGPF
jgi:hypothetical protein